MDLKEYVLKNKKQIVGWRDYLKQVDWTTIQILNKTPNKDGEFLIDEKETADKKQREFKLQHGIAINVYKRLKHLTKTYNSERKKPQYINFLEICLSVLNLFIETSEEYDLNIDLISIQSDFLREKELELQTEIFSKLSDLREKLADLDISVDSEVGTIALHGDKKIPLIAHDLIIKDFPQILDKLKEIGVSFTREPQPTFHINNKKAPVWDLERHYFDQEPKTLQYWIDELNKCKNGIMVDGIYISGWMYFHINHFVTLYPVTKINSKTGEEETEKIIGVPPLRDNEWWIMNDNYEEAKTKNKMIFIAATRRAAKTTLNTSHVGWSVLLNKKQILLASGSDKDLGQIREMFQVLENNITPAFRWINLVNDWSKIVEVGIKTKDGKNKVSSAVRIVNLDGGSSGKSELLAGFAPDAAIIDEIMKLPFKKQLGALKPALAGNGGKNLCVVILSGTSGNSELAQDAFDYLRDPETYGVLPMNWEVFNSRVPEPFRTWKERPFGTFLPGQMSTKTGIKKIDSNLADFLNIEESEVLKNIPIKITDWEQSLGIIKEDRKKLEKDLVAYTQEVLYHPICPSDMLLSGKKNPFPVELAIAHRERLKAEGGRGIKCFLYQDASSGEIKYNLSNNPLPEYPFGGGIIDSPVVLYEELPKEKPMDYLYVAGLDCYKQLEADSDSVGSFHIYKVEAGVDKNCGKIVASLATRPDPTSKFFQQMYLLQQAFNAKCLMENADTDYQTYLENKRVADIWLQESLDFDADMTKQGTNRRKYGWTPTPKNKASLLSAFTTYCRAEWEYINENGDVITTTNIERIDDIGLLDEIIAYDKDKNADRITSAMSCLGYERYLHANYLFPNINRRVLKQEREDNRKIVKNRTGGMFTKSSLGIFR